MGNGKGFSGVNTLQDFVFADNASFDGTARGGGLTTDGQLWIGQTLADRPNDSGHVKVGNIVGGAGVTVGYSSPNITISLTGGGTGVDSFAVPNGTSPVVPTAGGLITYTEGTGLTITGGLNTIDFSLDGGVVGQTITGDSGGNLSPTAGNWNIFGGPGVTTSGSGSTLTINSVVFTDQPASLAITSDSGTFATNGAGIILDLPATPTQGELIEVVCTTANAVAIDAPVGDFIRAGALITSSGGTLTSTAIGDAVVMRFNNANQTWYCTSLIGIWLVA